MLQQDNQYRLINRNGQNPYFWISIVLVIIALMDSMVMWGVPTASKLLIYGLKVLTLLSLPFLIDHNKKNIAFIWVFAVIPFSWILFDESSFLSFIQYFFSSVIPLVVFFLLPPHYQKWSVLSFIKVVSFLFCIGFFFYFLLNLGLIPPYLTYTRDSDGRTYYNFLFLYYTQGLDPLTLIRFTSVWDEPGVVGTMCAVILLYYRDIISNKRYYIVMIAGILSLSMFFLIMILPILYFSKFRVYSRSKQFRKAFYFILFLIIGYFSFSFLASKTADHPTLMFSIYSRFEWKNNLIVGVHSNRDVMPGFEASYKKFWRDENINELLFGKGKNITVEEFGSTGLSHRILIYEKGLLILMYLAVFYLLMHKYWKYDFVFNTVSLSFLILLFTQRPLLYGLYFVMVIYTGLRLKNVKINND